MQLDAEIQQDFVVEAGEILDKLDTQLIALEAAPRDQQLLNTVFRGFHTIKGGAGFLGLDALVAVSHQAEDVFDRLRTGSCVVTPQLMDVILRVLDTLRGMFETLSGGAIPGPAPAALLAELQAIAAGEVAVAPPVTAPADTGTITDDEFDALLDTLQAEHRSQAAEAGERCAPAAPAAMITDDEFEALLDDLHGDGRVKPGAAPAARAAAKDNTIRVGTEVLDHIMNMVGELVLIRNRLENLQAAIGNPEMTQAVANLDVVTSDLQMAAMKTRMQPIKKVFGRFPRVVRDLARSLHKQIDLEMVGEETDLDKNLVDALSDPLVHLVRNSCDHGIEDPASRIAAGKPPAGRLTLSAAQEGDRILLTIGDDGKGMDARILRVKAIEKGLLDQDAAARLSERECFELILLPGFSTAAQVSDVSGRGVGMDVVKTRIAQLNGSIEIDSKPGVGTTIRIRVPLTLAIMPTLMVVLAGQIFALPLVNVKEIIDFRAEQARDVSGKKTLVVRGKALPLFYLSRWLVRGVTASTVEAGHVVVVAVGNQRYGLLVDELIGQEEVVIKPLGAMLQGTQGVSGATITGNGRIALILDLPELIDVYGRRQAGMNPPVPPLRRAG